MDDSKSKTTDKWSKRLIWVLIGALATHLIGFAFNRWRDARPALIYQIIPTGPLPESSGPSWYTHVLVVNDGNIELSDVIMTLPFEDQILYSTFSRAELEPSGLTIIRQWAPNPANPNVFAESVASLPRDGSCDFFIKSSGPIRIDDLDVRSREVVGAQILTPTLRPVQKSIVGIFGKDEGAVERLLRRYGVLAIGLLMLLNGIISTPPSEFVMGLGGVLVQLGISTFFTIVLAATLGNVTGHIILYYFGMSQPVRWVRKSVTKVFLAIVSLCVGEDKPASWLEEWSAFFAREKTNTKFIIISIAIIRCIPWIRSVISISAGMAQIDLRVFLLATVIGDLLWIIFWTMCGWILGPYFINIALDLSIMLLLGGCLGLTTMIMVIRRKGERFVSQYAICEDPANSHTEQ